MFKLVFIDVVVVVDDSDVDVDLAFVAVLYYAHNEIHSLNFYPRIVHVCYFQRAHTHMHAAILISFTEIILLSQCVKRKRIYTLLLLH